MDAEVPQQKSTLLIIFLLLVIIVGVVFAAGSLSNIGTATTTATTTQQCPVFDEETEAFRLAQIAELYRMRNPDPRNYGLGSYFVCYVSGEIGTYQTPVFAGANDTTGQNSINSTHSEQLTYRQLQNKLANPALHVDDIVNIFVVIFSQVIVCDSCIADMVSWQSVLRQKAGVEQLFLSVWQLRPGQGGFNPRLFPRGLKAPIAPAGIEQVDVPFLL